MDRGLEQYGGRLVDDAGDGLFAAFDGPARAILAAAAIRREADHLGLRVRAGVHTAEAEPAGANLRGAAVHMAARIMAIAEPGDIVVSATTVDLVSGSGLSFEPHGVHELRGLSGQRELFRLVSPGG